MATGQQARSLETDKEKGNKKQEGGEGVTSSRWSPLSEASIVRHTAGELRLSCPSETSMSLVIVSSPPRNLVRARRPRERRAESMRIST